MHLNVTVPESMKRILDVSEESLNSREVTNYSVMFDTSLL